MIIYQCLKNFICFFQFKRIFLILVQFYQMKCSQTRQVFQDFYLDNIFRMSFLPFKARERQVNILLLKFYNYLFFYYYCINLIYAQLQNYFPLRKNSVFLQFLHPFFLKVDFCLYIFFTIGSGNSSFKFASDFYIQQRKILFVHCDIISLII